MYNALLVREELWEDEEVNEQIQEILLDTAWEADLPKIQPALEQITQLALN